MADGQEQKPGCPGVSCLADLTLERASISYNSLKLIFKSLPNYESKWHE